MNKNEILKYYYGYDNLKPEQERVIDSILDGLDTIAILPTGFGKTITFIIPALMLEGITLVISPLISLMLDQVKNLKAHYIKAEFINSLVEYKDIIYDKLLKNKIKILYLSAERLADPKLLSILNKIKISMIVCDEAHTLLWSEDFRKGMLEIKNFINNLKDRPKLAAFTATSTANTTKKITDILSLNNPNIIKYECDRKNIFYKIIKARNKDKMLLKLISGKKEKIIIYTLTVNRCIYLNKMLAINNIDSLIYHGKLDNDLKKESYQKFKDNEVNIIIATNAFGMGIDIPDIRMVIIYGMPSSLEDFSQQVGRASRDNKYATGIILYNYDDIKTIEYFIENIYDDDLKKLKKIKNERYEKLDKVVDFCLTKKCLHKGILEYFDFEGKECKIMCSNCLKKTKSLI